MRKSHERPTCTERDSLCAIQLLEEPLLFEGFAEQLSSILVPHVTRSLAGNHARPNRFVRHAGLCEEFAVGRHSEPLQDKVADTPSFDFSAREIEIVPQPGII